MSKAATQTKGEQAAVSIETGGDLFRSLTGLLDPLVDECKVRFDADDEEKPALHVTAVDSANVGMVSVKVPSVAFETYEVPEDVVLGLDLDELTSITDYARKGGNSKDNPGDPVTLELVGERLYVRVLPEDKFDRTGSFFQIDPDSIRKEPDLPDLSLPWEGKADASAFRDAVKGIESRFDFCGLSTTPGTGGNGSLGDTETAYLSVYAAETDEGTVRREDEFRSDERIMSGGDDPVTSLFSLDYLKDMAEAVVSAGFKRVGVELGDEFPIRIKFGGAKWGINGTYMLAPRIESDETPTTRGWEATWGDRYEGADDEEDEE